MQKNYNLSCINKQVCDASPFIQNNLSQPVDDYPLETLHSTGAITDLSPGMAQAIQESIEVSFGKN